MARLLTNLQGEDAIEDAAHYGFDFPTESSEDLRRAMDALLEQSEELGHGWSKESGRVES